MNFMAQKTKILLVLGLIVIVSASFYLFRDEDVALAVHSANLSGWAWGAPDTSGNGAFEPGDGGIGWISFNCADREVDTGKTCLDASNPGFDQAVNLVDYGVNVDPGGIMSGYAWSDNIGWIDFSPGGPYPEPPNHGARLDTTTGQVTGWAKALPVRPS